MNLYINCDVLNRATWNKSYGNKTTHLFYGLNLAHKHGINPIINCKSELNDIFDLSKITQNKVQNTKLIFDEKLIFDIPTIWQDRIKRYLKINLLSQKLEDVIQNSEIAFKESEIFLNNSFDFDNDFTYKGHFWHYKLMPSQTTIEQYISIKQENIDNIDRLYPTLKSNKSIAVHLRETDFANHQRHVFKKSIVLDNKYYINAINLAKHKLGNDLEFHLFSDNIDRIEEIFKDEKYITHKDNAILDWTALSQSKNIIQSNSSFCWSASLFNKFFSIQPSGGYNYYNRELGTIPYGFIMPFSELC